MTRTEDALNNFNNGYDCCKAVVAAFRDELDLDDKHKLECVAKCTSLPGKPGELCGAVIGALGVIKNLNEIKQDEKLKSDLVDKFRKKFLKKNDSIKCKELLGCDISDPYALMDVIENNLIDEVCSKYVVDAVEILNNILANNSE